MAQRDPDVRVKLTPEGLREVVGALRTVQKEAEAAGTKQDAVVSRLATAARRFLPAIGGAAVASTLARLATSASELFDALGKSAERVGATVEEVSALAFAARTSDVNLEQLQAALAKTARAAADFRRGTGEAAETLRELGLSSKDFDGLNTAQAFELIAKRVAALPAGVDRARAVVKLFGDEGVRLVPLLQDVAQKGLAQLRAEAISFNALVTGETSQAAQQFNDDLVRLQLAASGAARSMTAKMLPALAEVSKAVAEAAREGGVLSGVWAALGGAAALALGRTDVQKQRREIEAAAEQVEQLEALVTRTQEMLAAGTMRVPLLGDVGLSETGIESLARNLEKQLAQLDEARKRLARLREEAAKPARTAGADPGLGAEIDATKRLGELLKSASVEQLKTLEDIAKRRQELAQLDVAQQQRTAQARARSDAEGAEIEAAALARRRALLQEGFDTELRLARTREQVLAQLAAQSEGRSRLGQELQRTIASQSLDAQLGAAQRYYAALVALNADYLRQYETSKQRIKALDDQLAASRQARAQVFADAARRELTAEQQANADLARLRNARAELGSAVLRRAADDVRKLDAEITELVSRLASAPGFESIARRLSDESDDLLRSFTLLEKGRESALGRQAEEGARSTERAIADLRNVVKDLSTQRLDIRPDVPRQALGELHTKVQQFLRENPFVIRLKPQIEGGGAPVEVPGFAQGGRIPGVAPHPRADNALIFATPGEFMMPVRAVEHYGPQFMEQVRSLQLPKFADGGLVGDDVPGAQRDVLDINLNIGGSRIRLQGRRDQARELQRVLRDLERGGGGRL